MMGVMTVRVGSDTNALERLTLTLYSSCGRQKGYANSATQAAIHGARVVIPVKSPIYHLICLSASGTMQIKLLSMASELYERLFVILKENTSIYFVVYQ